LLIRRQVPRNAPVEVLLDWGVRPRPEESDPAADAFGVCVDDEDRMAARVQEDGVRGLRPDAVLSQEVRAHHVRGTAEVTGEIAPGSLEEMAAERADPRRFGADRKSTRLNSSHVSISYAVFCLKKK